jgi:hypothetical protein
MGGKSAGGWTSVGILTGNLVHLTYCLLGIGWLIANSIVAFTILKLAGGAYLIFLGFQSLRPNSNGAEDIEASARYGRMWWLQGLLNNLLNPKGPLFYLWGPCGLGACQLDHGVSVPAGVHDDRDQRGLLGLVRLCAADIPGAQPPAGCRQVGQALWLSEAPDLL